MKIEHGEADGFQPLSQFLRCPCILDKANGRVAKNTDCHETTLDAADDKYGVYCSIHWFSSVHDDAVEGEDKDHCS
jgi:hypothetical protein